MTDTISMLLGGSASDPSSASSFFSNNFVFSSLVVMFIGGIVATISMAYSQLYDYMYKRFVVSLEVTNDHPSFHWLQRWIEKQSFFSDTRNVAIKEINYNEDLIAMNMDNNIVQPIEFAPASGDHYFIYKGKYIWMTKSIQNRMDREDKRTIVLRSFDSSTNNLQEIMEECRAMEIERLKSTVVVMNPQDVYWNHTTHKTKRSMHSVVLDSAMKESILTDISTFLSSKTWYVERGLPYRRGYLFHGPPGCGKSSILLALAGHFGLNLCCFSASKMDDGQLISLLQNVPPRSAVLMEDVDCIFSGRKQEDFKGISFSAFLNAIDGVGAAEGRIMFLTTNHPERLSKALIRPGRVDRTYEFGLASTFQIETLFSIFFPSASPESVKSFSSKIPTKTVSPAAIQGHLLNHRESEASAIDNVNLLFEKNDAEEEIVQAKEKVIEEEGSGAEAKKEESKDA
eukprot:TRINITY_DN7249_c0_g1_i1.p1 TRINITY_DN7249_c0_g1~~TRINITY_DN7249_c0_g1_i1.p1  ORF type:complete len:456 (+),score=146.47 TRINITY_DN7249_c0_g1_i1:162-1529(+)